MTDEVDDIGWTGREKLSGAGSQKSVFELGAEAANSRQIHGSSRTIGQVMQCGPPPPRTSSPPSKVSTALSSAGMSTSSARKSDADIILKPTFSSSLRVVSLRAYEVTTPGLSAVKLHPDAHCSRSCTMRRVPPQRIRPIGIP